MRINTANFDAGNTGAIKSLRYTIEVAFDDAYTDLYYLTSHADSATPPSVTIIGSVVHNISATSQHIQPSKAIASIGSLSFEVLDVDNAIRSMLASELALGNSLKHKRVRFYVGYEGDPWEDYSLIQTQIIDEIVYKDSVYRFKCSDVQRLERRDIFDRAITTLAISLTETDTVVTVYDTSAFIAVKHSAYWSDAPNETVYYILIEKEVIRATGKTSTTFTGCTRGALNTRTASHVIDITASADRRTTVSEHIYLEMPAPKMIYALMTGVLYGDSATLPDGWHLGVPTEYVKLDDFLNIGVDLWDVTDEALGTVARFSGEEKQDGKKFIEEQLNLMIACFNPIYGSGELGLRRMTSIISDAAHVLELNADNVVSHSELTHSMKEVRNYLNFIWNWEPSKKIFTRKTILIDAGSIAKYGDAVRRTLSFRGVHGALHTTKTIEKIFDSLRDRFSAPPLIVNVRTLFANNSIEVGDVVKLQLETLQDYNSDSTVDRAFEVQRVSVDWLRGTINLRLFGSAIKAGTIIRSDTNTVLQDPFYTICGNDLKTYVGGGYDATTMYSANHIVANGTLTGGADATNCTYVFYHDGDLTIDAGVVLSITENVQLRVRGFLTVNGTVDGKGAANVAAGYVGYAGNAKAGGGGGIALSSAHFFRVLVIYSTNAPTVIGLNSSVPELTLEYDTVTETLNGLPVSLRGSESDSGLPVTEAVYVAGGAAGAAGAGLLLITRGLGFGVSGKIDLSGTDGAYGGVANFEGVLYEAGGGAGGGAGSLYVLLDGSDAVATYNADNVILCHGDSPQRYPPWDGIFNAPYYWSSSYQGIKASCNFEAFQRVQYIPTPVIPEPDVPEPMPDVTGFISSYNSRTLLLEWNAVVSELLSGYEIRYNVSTNTSWDDGSILTSLITGTSYTTGAVPNGSWVFMIKALSTEGGYSVNAASTIIAVDNQFVVVDSHQVSPAWLGAQSHAVRTILIDAYNEFDNPSWTKTNATIEQVNETQFFDGSYIADKLVEDAVFGAHSISHDFTVEVGKDYEMVIYAKAGERDLINTAWQHPTVGGITIWGNYDLTNNIILAGSANYTDISITNIGDGWSRATLRYDNCPANGTSRFYVALRVGGTDNYVGDGSSGLYLAYVFCREVTDGKLVKTFDNKLILTGVKTAIEEGWETFDEFNPNPAVSAVYESSEEFAFGFDSSRRVSSIIESNLPPTGLSGLADPQFQIDYKVLAGSYDGYENWNVGNALASDIRYRLLVNSNIGIPVITGFQVTVDVEESSQTAASVTIGATGTNITFSPQFHNTPFVQIIIEGATALTYSISAISATSFTIHLYNNSGTEVGGTITWKATGV